MRGLAAIPGYGLSLEAGTTMVTTMRLTLSDIDIYIYSQTLSLIRLSNSSGFVQAPCRLQCPPKSGQIRSAKDLTKFLLS